MTQQSGDYFIEVFNEETFKEGSSDNTSKYQHVYFNESDYIFPTIIGVEIYKNNQLVESAVIGSIGGGGLNHNNSIIIETNRLLICCADKIFCLSIPKLDLIWETKCDESCCFEIFKYLEDYIIHGELNITRINKDGQLIWQQDGGDIFVSPDGKDTFQITDKYITVNDWENRNYKFDFNGNLIQIS